MERTPQESQRPSPEETLDVHAEYFNSHPEDIQPEYLNNLHLWLPGTEFRKQMEGISTIDIAPRTNPARSERYQQRSLRQFLQDIEDAVAQLPEVQQGLEQVKRDEEDMRAKLKELDEQRKTRSKELEQLPEEERSAAFRKDVMPLFKEESELSNELRYNMLRYSKVLVPLYIYLRKQGYSHLDLIS